LLLPVLALQVFWLWPLSVAAPIYGVAVALSIAVYALAMKTMRMPRLNGSDGIVGRLGRVVQVGARRVTLQLGGEYWRAGVEGADFKVGDQALVTGIDRLRLKAGRPRGTNDVGVGDLRCSLIDSRGTNMSCRPRCNWNGKERCDA
jgi:membrane protein implicated in regulation of membrane protease activity